VKETFIRKNDIGVDIEYTIVGRFNTDNREYIIYTDFVSDKEYGLRLFVDMKTSDKYIPLSYTGRNIVLEQYKNEIKKYISSL